MVFIVFRNFRFHKKVGGYNATLHKLENNAESKLILSNATENYVYTNTLVVIFYSYRYEFRDYLYSNMPRKELKILNGKLATTEWHNWLVQSVYLSPIYILNYETFE